MECSQARSRIIASSVDEEVEDHLRACEACTELAAEDGRLAKMLGVRPTVEPDAARYQALIDSIREEDDSTRGKLRAIPTSRRIAIAFSVVLLGAMVFFLTSLRPDWGVYPMMRMALVITSMVVAAGFAVVLAMPRIYKPASPGRFRLALFVFLLAIPFVPAMLPVAHDLDASFAGGSFWGAAGACLGFGTAAAIPAILVIRALQRDTDFSMWSTLFAALAAAISANLALQIHCPVVDPMHIAVSHSLLGLIYAGLAWLVVRGFSRPG